MSLVTALKGQPLALSSNRAGLVVGDMILGLTLSHFGSGILLNIGGNYYPEFGIVLAVTTYWIYSLDFRGFLASALSSPKFLVVAMSTLLLFFLSVFREGISLLGQYSALRSLLVFILGGYFYLHALKRGQEDRYLSHLVRVGLFALGGAIFYQAVFPTGISTKGQVPIIAGVIAFAVAMHTKRFGIATLAIVLLAGASVVGFYRQYVVLLGLCGLAYLMSLSPSGIKIRGGEIAPVLYWRRAVWLFWAIFGLAATFIFLSGPLLEYLASSESRYIQSIAKWEDLMGFFQTGVATRSELGRLIGFDYLFRNLDAYLLPNGIVDDDIYSLTSIWGGQAFSVTGISLMRDSLLAYFVVMIGWFGTIGFLVWWSWRVILGSFTRRDLPDLLGYWSLAAAFIIVLFLDGMAGTQVEKAFFTGAAIAYGLYPPGRSAKTQESAP